MLLPTLFPTDPSYREFLTFLFSLFGLISSLQILKLWEELGAFEQSLKLSEGRPEFTFYDGPPFATGLPHYGTSLSIFAPRLIFPFPTLIFILHRMLIEHTYSQGTCWRARSRTLSLALPTKRGIMWCGALAGTAMACPWSLRLTRNWASRTGSKYVK